MRKSALIVMVDVMVLSVLSMQVGDGDSRFPVPIHRWSELIERGIQKEEAYQEKIAELENAISNTRDAAKKAELQALLAEEKEEMAQKEAERMRAKREEAEEKAQAAVEAAKQAEVEARSEAAEKSLASREAERARIRKEKALQQALDAEKQASAAKERATLAQEELEDKLDHMAEIKSREAEMLKKARQAESRAKQAETRATSIEERMKEIREDYEKASDQERKYAELMAQAREEEAEIRGKADTIEEELRRTQATIEEKSDEIADLSGEVVGLSHAEKAAREDLEEVEYEKTELTSQLDEIEREKQESVWVKRDKSIQGLNIHMVEKDIRSQNDVKKKVLNLPLLSIGDKPVMVSEFETLELDWWEIQVDRNIIKLLYTIKQEREESSAKQCRAYSMTYKTDEPRVLYLPFNCDAEDFETLSPVGMKKLKEQRIQTALLFKAEDTDASAEVKVTPALRDNYLSVKDVSDSDVDIDPGDYLLTERGQFIGIMVTRDKCHVVPKEMPSEESTETISMTKSPKQEYYEAFVSGARKLKQRVKEITKDSFWF